MPRRKQQQEDVDVEDVTLGDDEVLVAPDEDDDSASGEIQPLVEGAPVSAAARSNARYGPA